MSGRIHDATRSGTALGSVAEDTPPIERTPLRRACRGTGRHNGRVREYAAVFEIRRHASCAKRVMTDAGRNASGSCAPTDHPMRAVGPAAFATSYLRSIMRNGQLLGSRAMPA